jgi:hypothetical protein
LPRRRATGPSRPEHREPPPFDALALKQQVQDELVKTTAGMTREEERSFYRQRARTGPLGAWWAQVESQAQGRPGSINGKQAASATAPDRTVSIAPAEGSAGSPTAEIIARLLDRLKSAIGERGYEAVVEDLISDDLIGGDDSRLASDDIMVIPGHMDDASRPILLAVTRGWNGKDALSFTRVMRQIKARLISGQGTIQHVVVFCNAWDTLAFEEEHREELEAHARLGVQFSFMMVGVPDRVIGTVPVELDHSAQ